MADSESLTRPSAAFASTVVAQGAQGALRLVLSVAVGRYFGKEWLGVTTTLLAVTTFLVLCWPQALGVTAAKFTSSAVASSWSAIRHTVLRQALVASLILAPVGALISVIVIGTSHAMALTVALSVIALGTSNAARGVLQGRHQFARTAVWDVITAIMALGVLALVIAQGAREWVLLPIVASCVLGPTLTVADLVARGREHRSEQTVSQRELLHFTAWSTAHMVAKGILLPAVTFATALISSHEEVGELGAALAFSTPLFMVWAAFRTTWEPYIARFHARGDSPRVRASLQSLFNVLILVFIGLLGMMLILSEVLIDVAFGPEFESAVGPLRIMLLAMTIQCINPAHVWMSSASTWGSRSLAFYNLVALALALSILVPGTLVWGATGAALAVLMASATSTMLATVTAWRRGSLGWRAQLEYLAIGAVLTAVVWTISLRSSSVLTLTSCTSGFLALWAATSACHWNRLKRNASA